MKEKPDWKDLAICTRAHVKTLLQEASAPNWVAPTHAVVSKRLLAALEGDIERIEEAMKRELMPSMTGAAKPYGDVPMPIVPWDVNAKIDSRLTKLEAQIHELTKKTSVVLDAFFVRKQEKTQEEMEESAKKSLENTTLPIRVIRCLQGAGINTLGDAAAMSPDELLRIPNLGRKGLRDLVDELSRCGLSLKPEAEP